MRKLEGLSRYLRRGAVVALACAGLLVAACGGGADEEAEVGELGGHHITAQGEELPTVSLPARWAWGDAQQLGTLIGSADAVFSGTVVALKGQRPALSQPDVGGSGASAPRWADLPVSQFEVRLESVVFGNLTPGSPVTLEQIGGVETRPDGTQVRLMLMGDEPLQVGQKYLFFGSFQENGSSVAPPFGRMKVQSDGRLVAEVGWEHLGALAELSRRNLGDAERQISATAGD